MRKFVITSLLVTLSFLSFGQIVSLSQKEISALQSGFLSNGQGKKMFTDFEKLATSYLSDQPNPIDTIRTEGLLKGNPKKIKTQNALADMNKMFVLALQFRLNGDKIYLDRSLSFLTAWAEINRPNGDPIDDTNLDKAVEAYDLIKNNIAAKDKLKIEKWLHEMAFAEINSKRMKSGRATAKNNWNAHRLKVVGEIGYVLNDHELIDWMITNLKSHIHINLNPDGTSLDFKERDAMHYHIYDLEPMLKLAIMINRASGENFYTFQSATGSSIKKSVDWLLPYISGDKQHEEYVNTTVKFDRDRAKNNEPGFVSGTMFEPKSALPVLQLSVYFDANQIPLLNKISKGVSWQTFIDQVKRESK